MKLWKLLLGHANGDFDSFEVRRLLRTTDACAPRTVRVCVHAAHRRAGNQAQLPRQMNPAKQGLLYNNNYKKVYIFTVVVALAAATTNAVLPPATPPQPCNIQNFHCQLLIQSSPVVVVAEIVSGGNGGQRQHNVHTLLLLASACFRNRVCCCCESVEIH